ncbi:uncharacterized protein Z520_06678 [Fonsecaea multimorphosa CBS 102226]|uniref:Uncharacterized protein n=1 Tax=Fonsecaea multimorphosa CBS 102226 TaxID=1442371 RepID=A0A0D2H7W4_9EURO|nr:uncharacterized protein Z520_06678 [Fonsecaea multimorphosa CBS 102226]KIX97900.1 hypothetical protein Z520_06678 [Fonsecaea multimorphosa CBS 102226]OAL23670.1 hypothetical protein AYO22_06247 [Fonsecaea multimorphosa]
MVLSKLAQLPALPSMRLNTVHAQTRSKELASASVTDSATPSPTQSTQDTSTSAGGTTSVSDPDDYADTLATNPVSSATMRSKRTTTTTNPSTSTIRRNSDKAGSFHDRRASSRVRKPTAKAQGLSGIRKPSPPLLDTIVIERSSPKPGPSFSKEPSTTAPLPKDTSEEAHPDPKVAQPTPTANSDITKTPSPTQVAGQEAPVAVAETPSRRTSQRERKPTAKLLSESSTSQKRPATDDAPDAPPRKSARLSSSAARVPSKLRYSISAENSEIDDVAEVEKAPPPEIPSPQKSKIVVLKSKRLAEVFGPPPKPKPGSSSYPSRNKRKSKRRVQRIPVSAESAIAKPDPRPVEIPGSCNLFCLSPSSRLLAFAEIAYQMPDEEDENEETVPGSVYDWRMYTQVWCRCDKDEQTKSDRTDSVELARALMPNPVQGTSYDPIDLTSNKTPEVELLSTPVNTILRATDAERLSQLYTEPPSYSADQTPNGTTLAPNDMRTRDGFVAGASYRPSEFYTPVYEAPSPNGVYSAPHSAASRRTYEQRLIDDHNALTDIRKRAAARGIAWTFNMTFDDIHGLIMEAEDREQQLHQQAQYRQQVMSPPQNVIDRAYGYPGSHPSPSGFGVLLPPRVTHQARRAGSGQKRRKASFAPPSSVNGAAETAQERHVSNATPSNVSFVEDSTPPRSSRRRPSSSSRPKSSRFRVDPRGLRGESPGPGTIINMNDKRLNDEMRREAEGLEQIGIAMREFEEYQKRQEEEVQERWRQSEQRESRRLNGRGHGQP